MSSKLPALMIVACAPFAADRAEACSFVEPTIEAMPLTLDEGATVPTNLVIHGDYVGDDDGSSWWLLDPQGAPQQLTMAIAADEGVTRLTPAAPLTPSTSWQLVWSATQAAPTSTETALRFTTADDVDDTAPDAPVVWHETKAILPGDSGCGLVEGATWARFFVEPDDGVAMYRLRDETGDSIHVNVTPLRTLTDDGEVFLGSIETRGGTFDYDVTAIDHAGNESAPTTLTVGLGCPGSCSAGDASGLSLGALLAIALRRRRRR